MLNPVDSGNPVTSPHGAERQTPEENPVNHPVLSNKASKSDKLRRQQSFIPKVFREYFPRADTEKFEL